MDLPARASDPEAEVQLLVVHEIRLVESADLLQSFRAESKRGSEDPFARRASVCRPWSKKVVKPGLPNEDATGCGKRVGSLLRPAARIDE